MQWAYTQMKKSWARILRPFVESKEFEIILSKLRQKKKETKKNIYPHFTEVFRAFGDFEYDDLKVVSLGQDPYPQPGVANGRAFCCEATGVCQPSLVKIHEAIRETVYPEEDYRYSPSVKHIAEQGVLLLNIALTVEENTPNQHKGIWEPFIRYLLGYLNAYSRGLVFIFMGAKAREYEALIGPQHYKLFVEHPAAPTYRGGGPWKHENVFNRVNQILWENNGFKIEW